MSDEPEDDRTVTISMGCDLQIKVSELWPDGDAPKYVSAEAVKALLETEGSKGHVLRDWDLIDALDINVFSTYVDATGARRSTQATVW